MKQVNKRRDALGEEVARAYAVTTAPQRLDVALDWTNGRQTLHYVYAGLLKINSHGLLVASLLEAEHESVCKENGRPRATSYEKLFQLATRWSPVESTVQPVDN